MAKRLGPPAESLAQRFATGCGEGGAEAPQRLPLVEGPIHSWFAEVGAPCAEGAAELSWNQEPHVLRGRRGLAR